jgi:hypothetical protein
VIPTTPETDQIAAVLGAFLASIVPSGTPVIQGPLNRVAQPKGSHIMFSYLFERRMRTNVDTYTDTGDPGPPSAQGTRDVEQGTEVHYQLDFYSASDSDTQLVAKWAAAVSTLFRDDYGCTALAPVAAPLYIDDARAAPFPLGEMQYVARMISTAVLQYNPVSSIPQQFADSASATLIVANSPAYPPTP